MKESGRGVGHGVGLRRDVPVPRCGTKPPSFSSSLSSELSLSSSDGGGETEGARDSVNAGAGSGERE